MTTITTMTDPPDEIDYRTIPNWMIPQLSYLRKRLGIIVTNATKDYPNTDNRTDSAVIRAFLPSQRTYYLFRIYKAHMRTPSNLNTWIPTMFEVI